MTLDVDASVCSALGNDCGDGDEDAAGDVDVDVDEDGDEVAETDCTGMRV